MLPCSVVLPPVFSPLLLCPQVWLCVSTSGVSASGRPVLMEQLVKHLSRCQHLGWMNVIGKATRGGEKNPPISDSFHAEMACQNLARCTHRLTEEFGAEDVSPWLQNVSSFNSVLSLRPGVMFLWQSLCLEKRGVVLMVSSVHPSVNPSICSSIHQLYFAGAQPPLSKGRAHPGQVKDEHHQLETFIPTPKFKTRISKSKRFKRKGDAAP